MSTSQSIGHISIPVWNMQDTLNFYEGMLGCPHGRLSETKADFNFFGQHLVVHVASERMKKEAAIEQPFNERLARHFGVIVGMDEYKRIVKLLEGHDITYVIEPKIENEGTEKEEGLVFFLDPAMNSVEIKGFKNPKFLSPILG
jgi:extradiol dioxygenase family protein